MCFYFMIIREFIKLKILKFIYCLIIINTEAPIPIKLVLTLVCDLSIDSNLLIILNLILFLYY